MKHVKYSMCLICCILLAINVNAQTTLISPAGDGGFETGGTLAANNWTAINSSIDNWVVGATPVVSSGTNCAYISSDGGATWNYSQTIVVQHIYYDVTIPANESKLTLTFKWKAQGEGTLTNDYDNMQVYFIPNSVTPVVNEPLSVLDRISGTGSINGMYKLNSGSYNAETIHFTGLPGSSYRLVFSWKSDFSVINNPPAAIDEIMLVSDIPTTYTWNQSTSTSFATAANWTPNRTTPTITDILVADGNVTSSATITGVTSQTIGQFMVINNANLQLQGNTTTLTLGGGNGDDLVVETGSTLDINGASALTIAFSSTNAPHVGTISGTLNLSGSTSNTLNCTNSLTTVDGTVNNFGTITSTSSNLTFSGTSMYNHTYTTSGGIVPRATWSTGSTCSIIGFSTSTSLPSNVTSNIQSFSNFIWDCPNQTVNLTLAGNTLNANGTFTMRRTNSGSLRLGTLGTGGTINCTNFVQDQAGTLDLSSGSGGGTINVTGTFNRSAGTLTETGSGTANKISFNGTSAQSPSIGTLTNSVGVRINNPAGVNVGTLTINDGATFTVTQGAVTGAVTYTNSTAKGAILVYDGTAAQTTSDAEFPASNGPGSLTINNASGVTLHGSRTLNPPVAANIALTLTVGVFSLGDNDLTIGSNGTVSVSTPANTKMVSTSGTGQMKKAFPIGASTFTFPIGENTGTTEYSPITFTFSANNTARTIGVRVVDADPPSNGGSTTYISRYWPVTNDAAGTYTYGAAMTYIAGASDVVGGEGSLLVQFNNGSFYSDVTSSVSSPTLTILDGANETTTPFDNTGNTFLTGRRSPPTNYTWNGTAGDWGTATNWTPNGIPGATDNVTVGSPGLSISGARTIGNFTLNGTGTLDLPAAASLTINGAFTYNNSGGATATFNCTSTLTLGSSGTVTVPALTYGNLTRSGGGSTTLASSGTIGICGTFTPGAGSYTTTGSTVDFTSSGSQTIPAFSYNNLDNSGGGARTLANGTIGIAGVYTPTSGAITVGTNVMNFSSASSQTIPASSYYNITNTGNGPRTLASAGVIIVNGTNYSPGSGAYTVTGSTVRFAGGSISALPSCTFNDLEITGGTISMATGGVTQTVLGNYTQSGGTFNLGNTTSANTMNVSGNFSMSGSSCTYNVISLSTSPGATLNIAGNFNISITSGKFMLETSSSTSGVATVNLDGNLVSSATASSFFDMGTGTVTNNAFNIKGDFTHSGTGTFWTGASSASNGIVFNGSGVQSFTNSGGAIYQYTQFTVNAGSTLKLLSNITLGTLTNPRSTFVVNGTLDMGTFAMAGASDPSFTLNSGATLKIANATGMAGAFAGFTGARTYSSAANYEFQGAATGTFATSPTALKVNNLTVNNTGGDVSMGQAFTVEGTLNLTAGRLLLGANNLEVIGGTSVAGFSAMGTDATSYVVTNGSGVFTMPLKPGVPKIFPIGLAGSENTFNPIQLTNAGVGGNFSVKLDNIVNNTPNDPTRICNLDYDVTSAVSPISLAMSTQWEAANQASNFLPTNPVVMGHFTGGAWQENATIVNGGPFPFYASTIDDFTSLSPFTPANALALPLELASFTGKTQEKTNMLYWETLSEKDVQWHIVERSTDGINWSEAGRQAGKQESHVSVKYQLEDRTPPAKAYYRLRSVDYNGLEYMSNSILLTRSIEQLSITTVYPSPAHDKLNAKFDAPGEEKLALHILDAVGRLVMQQTYEAAKGENEMSLNVSGLQAGVYQLILFGTGEKTKVMRIIKE